MGTWKQQLAQVRKGRKIGTYSRTAIVEMFDKATIAGLMRGDFNNAAERDGIRHCELCDRFYDADYHQSHISDSLTNDVDAAASEIDSFSWCCEFCREEAIILAPVRRAEDQRLMEVARHISTVNFLDAVDAYSRGNACWSEVISASQ